jgi:hypothetical protein
MADQSTGTDNEDVVTITAPRVSGQEAEEATDLVLAISDKYNIPHAEVDGLFNAICAIFVRGRMIYADRSPTSCTFAQLCGPGDDPDIERG